MRIAFVYDVPYPWHVGGIESMNYNEAEELAKDKNNEVHFFTTKWEGMKGNEFVYNGIHYHAYHKTAQEKIYTNRRRSVKEAAAYALSLTRLMKYKFDVVITNAFPYVHLPIIKLYCKLSGAKLILEVAEVWDEGYWRSYIGGAAGSVAYRYSKGSMQGANFYITISSTTTSSLMKHGVDKSRIMIFAPTLDDYLVRRVSKERAQRSKLVLFSGRLIKEKRMDKWLNAFKAAHKMDGSLRGLIIGSGPERENIARHIRQMKLGDAVKMRGYFKSTADLYRQIRKASVLLHTSEREGLGIIAIEAAALGTPVLIPRYSPMPKEVKEMCVEVDENALAGKIIEISGSKDKSRYIRNLGNLEIFSKSKIRNFYSKLFSRLD